MKTVPTDKIRNVVLVGHQGAGKTTLAEALLVRSGAVARAGKVEDGSTVCDTEPEEQKRRLSLSLAVAPFEWQGHKVNLIDTPGYADFVGELRAGLRAADCALFVTAANGPSRSAESGARSEPSLPETAGSGCSSGDGNALVSTSSSASRPTFVSAHTGMTG